MGNRSKRGAPVRQGWRYFQRGGSLTLSSFLCLFRPFNISMALNTTALQDGPVPPPLARPNTSTSLYFDAMPSMSSLFSRPRGQSRSSSPERGIKQNISAPIPTDPGQNPHQAAIISGDTNIGDGEDDKNTLRADDLTHGDGVLLASERPRQSSPIQAEGAAEMSRQASVSVYDVSSPASARKRSLSRSEDHGGGTDETSLRSVPVVYTNMVPEGEDPASSSSPAEVTRKVSVKRSPSKLVKRRSTKGKRTENLASGSTRGNVRSASRSSQRSFRSSRGPVFDMVTGPPNASIGDAGGAFGTGAVMAAPEHDIEDELQSGFQERVTIAESALTRKQTIKIQKEECTFTLPFFSSVRWFVAYRFVFVSVSVSKRISKIVESEGKAEKNSLEAAIQELKGIQKMQRVAVKVNLFFHLTVFVGSEGRSFSSGWQEETTVHASHIKSLQKYHEADIAVVKARAEVEKVEADIAARLAKVQADLNKFRVRAQGKVDQAVAEAEKAKAEVRARENHREMSRKHSERVTDWVRDKRKEVEVLRGWMAVDNVSGSSLCSWSWLTRKRASRENEKLS